jgi:capsular polysaccharide biosynthesis protein
MQADGKQEGRWLWAVREHWVLVVVSVAICAVMALVYTQVAQKKYEASTDVLVSPVSSDALLGLPVLRDSLTGRSVITAARMAQSPQVAARVRTALHSSAPLSAISGLIAVTPQQQSNILTISATSASPNQAARVANAFAQALVAERAARFQSQLSTIVASLSKRLRGLPPGSAEATGLSTQLAQYSALSGQPDPTLAIASPAAPPSAPFSPRRKLTLVVAIVVGLLLGVAIALGLEIANPRVTRAESLSERGGPPILARMPRLTSDDIRAALSNPDRVSPSIRTGARTLWAGLASTGAAPSHASTFLVTSPGAGDKNDDGGPATAAILAGLMARGGMSVTLVDADFQKGQLASIFDGEAYAVGNIGEILAATGTPAIASSAVPRGAPQRLRALLAYPDEDPLMEWLRPDRLTALVANLKGSADALIISAPPLPAAETAAVIDQADAVIVAVTPGLTRRDQLAQLCEAIAARKVPLAGFVVLEKPSLLRRAAAPAPTVNAAVEKQAEEPVGEYAQEPFERWG